MQWQRKRPRERPGSIVITTIPRTNTQTHKQDDAADAAWHDVRRLPPLAFDHKLVVRECFATLAALPQASGECLVVVAKKRMRALHLAHRTPHICHPIKSRADKLRAALKEGAEALAGDWERPTE